MNCGTQLGGVTWGAWISLMLHGALVYNRKKNLSKGQDLKCETGNLKADLSVSILVTQMVTACAFISV